MGLYMPHAQVCARVAALAGDPDSLIFSRTVALSVEYGCEPIAVLFPRVEKRFAGPPRETEDYGVERLVAAGCADSDGALRARAARLARRALGRDARERVLADCRP